MSLSSDEINIASITGPPFVVVILNWGLFGVLSIQVYLYSQAFPNDKAWLKVLVWAVYFLEMTQTFLLTDTAWKMLVSGFGNLDASDDVGTTWLSVCGIGGLVGFLVRWFYAYRIAIISQKWIVPGSITFMSLISFAGAIATAVNLKQANKFSVLLLEEQRLSTLFAASTIWGGPGSACDVVIAISMCYYLLKWRSNPYGRYAQTDAIIAKLIRMTVETGVLTATASILTLALYYPHQIQAFSYFQVPASSGAKLFSTTMMTLLNSRMKLGITSTSTTWRDHELAFATAHSTRDANRVELNVLSKDNSVQNTDVLVIKEEVAVCDDPKVHYNDPSVH